jgi:hypothetical protein
MSCHIKSRHRCKLGRNILHLAACEPTGEALRIVLELFPKEELEAAARVCAHRLGNLLHGALSLSLSPPPPPCNQPSLAINMGVYSPVVRTLPSNQHGRLLAGCALGDGMISHACYWCGASLCAIQSSASRVYMQPLSITHMNSAITLLPPPKHMHTPTHVREQHNYCKVVASNTL